MNQIEYYNIDEMIKDYNNKFENDCINNNYPIFYYKFMKIIKDSKIKELEELKKSIRII